MTVERDPGRDTGAVDEAEVWQRGYAAGLDRGRQADNHPAIRAVEVLRKKIPRPAPHVHEYGCGHDGEGITPDYLRGWNAGRADANEKIHAIVDEYARLSGESE